MESNRSPDELAARAGCILTPVEDLGIARTVARTGAFDVATFRAAPTGWDIERAGAVFHLNTGSPTLPFVDIAGVACSSRFLKQAERLAADLANFPRDIPLRRWSFWTQGADLRWLWERAAARTALGWKVAEHSIRQASALRQDVETLRRNFRRLEQHYQTYGRAEPVRIFQVLPDERATTEHVAPRRLRLPVQSLGVCRIDLWVNETDALAVDEVSVSLMAVETGEIVGRWAVGGEAPVGWRSFTLGHGFPDANITLDLMVEAHPGQTGHPFAASGLWMNEGGEVSEGLAVRVYAGLPGVRTGALLDEGRSGARTVLLGDTLRAAELVSRQPAGLDFNLLGFMDEFDGLLVHPTATGATIAVLPTPCPRGVEVITARVRHANPAGSPFAFTLKLGEGRLPSADFSVEENHQALASHPVQWSTLEGGEEASLRFVLKEPTRGGELIHLATATLPGQSGDGAWAIVQQIDCLSP